MHSYLQRFIKKKDFRYAIFQKKSTKVTYTKFKEIINVFHKLFC